MRLKRLLADHGSVVAVGVVMLLAAVGGGAYAATTSLTGASGVITACAHRHGGGLYVAKRCAKRDRKLRWNIQGPRGLTGRQGVEGVTGSQGPKGDTGAPGLQGPPGTGYQFTTASGFSGPTLTQGGTYFVDVEGTITSPGTIGFCSVNADNSVPSLVSNFADAFIDPTSQEPGTWSFSGMLVVPSNQTPVTTHITCANNGGTTVPISNVKWWVSPVGG